MKIYKNKNSKKIFLTIVACQHGNEQFGLEIIRALKPRLDEFSGLKLIIANEEVIAINKRGIAGDLNRSYPGNENGHHEQKLAKKILAETKDSIYLLDIHTSVSNCGFLVPIVASINHRTKRIINLLNQEKIICVEPPLSSSSLIGSVKAGVSLEFQKTLANQKAIDLTIKLVEDLYQGQKNRLKKFTIFKVTDIIPKNLELPKTARDFELIDELNFYPVLLKDANYMGNQGLKATRRQIMFL